MNLDDMIGNQSISASGADVLRMIARSQRSFLVHALPRNAGKSTTMQAILAESPPEVRRDVFYGTEEEMATLSAAPTPGYLLVAEIGHRGQPGYLAGEEVPRVFELVHRGYSLVSSLHADTVEQVFDVLDTNGVPGELAATVPYLIKVRMITDDAGTHVRRVVDEIHEITDYRDGRPSATLLYRWDQDRTGTPESWIEKPEDSHRGGRRRR